MINFIIRLEIFFRNIGLSFTIICVFPFAMASPFPMNSSAEALIDDLAARTTIEDGDVFVYVITH